MENLKQYFRPEFLNRIDEIITFNPLSKEVCYKIVDKMLNELKNRLHESKIKIDFTNNLKQFIIESSFSYDYVARVIKRFISKNIETLIANKIIKDEITANSSIIVDYDNEIIIKNI